MTPIARRGWWLLPALPGLIWMWRLRDEYRLDDRVATDFTNFELTAQQFLSGKLMTGVLAVNQFRNLGPIHSGWLGLGYLAVGRHIGGFTLAAIAWQIAWATTACTLLVRLHRWSLPRAAVTICFAQAFLGIIADAWNPGMTLWPGLCLILVTTSATSHWWVLAAWAGLASVLLQTHLASISLILACAVVAIGRYHVRRPSVLSANSITATVVVLALLWAPTAIDQSSGTQNLSRAVSVMSDEAQGATSTEFGRGTIASMAPAVVLPSFQRYQSSPYAYSRLPATSTTGVAIGWMIVAAALGWLAFRRRGGMVAVICVLTLIGVYLFSPSIFQSYYLIPLTTSVLALMLLAVAPQANPDEAEPAGPGRTGNTSAEVDAEVAAYEALGTSLFEGTPPDQRAVSSQANFETNEPLGRAALAALASTAAAVIVLALVFAHHPMAAINRIGRTDGVIATVGRPPRDCPLRLIAGASGDDLFILTAVTQNLLDHDYDVTASGVTAVRAAVRQPEPGEWTRAARLVEPKPGEPRITSWNQPDRTLRISSECRQSEKS